MITGFYWVSLYILIISSEFCRFYWVLLGFTGFVGRMVLVRNEFRLAFTGFYWVPLDLIVIASEFCRFLIEFYWVLLGFYWMEF